jgi:sugar phosphate isomerase/epimerase
MGASLDVGHIASCGFDTVDAVRRLAPHLKMVHLKDVKASGGEVNVLLGTGIARIPDVMKTLRAVNYGGLVAIEYEHDGPVEAMSGKRWSTPGPFGSGYLPDGIPGGGDPRAEFDACHALPSVRTSTRRF